MDGQLGQQELLFQELDQRLRDVRSGPDGNLWLLTDGETGSCCGGAWVGGPLRETPMA